MQVKPNDVFVESGPAVYVPLVPFVPLQPPEATQDVSLVLVHCRVALPPTETELGTAVRFNVPAGADGVTVTCTDLLTTPPLPVQSRLNVVD